MGKEMRKKLTSVEPPDLSNIGVGGVMDFKIKTQIGGGSKKNSTTKHKSYKSQVFDNIVMPNYESN